MRHTQLSDQKEVNTQLLQGKLNLEVALQADSCSADLCSKVGQIVLCALQETCNMTLGDFSCYFPAALCSTCNAESLHSASIW